MRLPRKLAARFRRGAVTPWLLLSLTAIVGVVALGMDGGRIMEGRRSAQATADAAALAAAGVIYQNYATLAGLDNGTAASAAKSIAAVNGYDASSVTVNIPPKSGTFSGKSGYAEVIIEQQLSATFGAIFTGQPLTVKFRAVAQGMPWKIGLIALNPSVDRALTTNGLAIVLANIPVYVNSSSSTALTNDALALTASSFQITGGYTSSGLMLGSITTGTSAIPDPLWSLPAPDSASYTVQSTSQLKIGLLDVVTLQPGIYRGGIAISDGGVANLEPGVYILDGGGLSVTGLSVVAGTGVMIYNTSITQPAGSISIAAALDTVILTPPTSGTYTGISLFQDRALSNAVSVDCLVAVMPIQGAIYAAAAPVTLSVSVDLDLSFGGLIADTINLTNLVGVNIELGAQPKAPNITLVE